MGLAGTVFAPRCECAAPPRGERQAPRCPPQVGPPLAVGTRRFPLTEYFLEDVAELAGLPERLRSLCHKLGQRCARGQADGSIPNELVATQVEIAIWVARLASMAATGGGGGAVLVFVSGLSEIEDLAEALAGLPAYSFVPIHSEIPFDEQLEAFSPAPAGVTKLIAATNAAESSVTLPDVDVVICLGGQKEMSYNQTHGAAQLRRTWISKASATQRAGRTARVRPGSVYRLYPRTVHAELSDHGTAEIHRQPLTTTLLQLRVMVGDDEPVCHRSTRMSKRPRARAVCSPQQALQRSPARLPLVLPHLTAWPQVSTLIGEAPEPPESVHVESALEQLVTMGMLERTADLGTSPLTQVGRLAAALPVDPSLARLLAYGVVLDVAAEAIAIAAGLSMPRLPYRVISPLIHTEPDSYNQACALFRRPAPRIANCHPAPRVPRVLTLPPSSPPLHPVAGRMNSRRSDRPRPPCATANVHMPSVCAARGGRLRRTAIL